MSALIVPVICVVIGEGCSGGALGIGVGDRILMLENAWYSVINPDSCSLILWRNRDKKEEAAEAMNEVGINACTDVTGYGLLGHLMEMCQASKVSAIIEFNKLPLIQGAFELAQKGFIPGGTKNNLDFVLSDVDFSNDIYKEQMYLMADAQTSGGLLISVQKDKA